MNLKKSMPMVLALQLLVSNQALAWLRRSYEDALVVERSELIVVACLKEGSVEYIPHKNEPNWGTSGEHRALLLIREVLKGEWASAELPVTIHYGLEPVVGGQWRSERLMPILGRKRDDAPKGLIEVFDTAQPYISGPPILKDARQENIWFLRRRSAIPGVKPGEDLFGIYDPCDLQLLDWKDYALTYLSKDPESAVREFAKTHPEWADRAKRYLDHLQVVQIRLIQDPAERYEKLLPFFLAGQAWNKSFEAQEGIVSCGKPGAERLRAVFDDPKYSKLRTHIILMWQQMGYVEIAPVLIALLEKHDAYWAAQKMDKGWWNQNFESELTRQRHDIYSEVYRSVLALKNLSDPRARRVLIATRDRWKSIDFGNDQIAESCEAALRALSKLEDDAQGGAAPDAENSPR